MDVFEHKKLANPWGGHTTNIVSNYLKPLFNLGMCRFLSSQPSTLVPWAQLGWFQFSQPHVKAARSVLKWGLVVRPSSAPTLDARQSFEAPTNSITQPSSRDRNQRQIKAEAIGGPSLQNSRWRGSYDIKGMSWPSFDSLTKKQNPHPGEVFRLTDLSKR